MRPNRRIREAIAGYLWITPWILGFLLFTLMPMVISAFLSFTRYNIISYEWIGWGNYVRAFTNDELFYHSLGLSAKYALFNVPLTLAIALLTALLLNQGLRGGDVFRTLFFLPSLTPTVAAVLLWQWLLHQKWGPINYVLGLVGIQGPSWLGDPKWALFSLVLISVWGAAGGGTMIIFLAGLQGIPTSLYDAARVDGAGSWHRFWHITIPMLTPTIFFNLIMGTIGALKVFTSAFVATQGGPNYATWFYLLHLYNKGFQILEMGYASALAWVFFVIVVSLTLVQFSLSKRWVYYEAEV